MGNYYIFRVEKLSPSKLRHNVQHALREIACPDADPARKHLNIQRGAATYKEFREQLNAKLKGVRKFRSDSPEVLEFFISASHDFFERRGDEQKLFSDSFNEIVRRFGRENILLTTIHRDETSPHMSVFVVPLAKNPELAEYEAQQRGEPPPPPAKGKKGRRRTEPFTEQPPEICLSAKAYINGPKALAQMQTEFWEVAGKGLGLDRGEEGSKARHVNVNDWKKMMAWVQDGMPMPEFAMPEISAIDRMVPGKLETVIREAYAKQFDEIIKLSKILAADATVKIKKTESTAKRLNELKKYLETAQTELNAREAQMEAAIREKSAEEAFKIAEAGLAGVKARLDRIPVLEGQVATLQAKSVEDDSEKKRLATEKSLFMRALAKTIKSDYSGEKMVELEAALGVAPGKDDIFARLVKSGRVENFESAVALVASYINYKDDEDDESGERNAVGVTSESQKPA